MNIEIKVNSVINKHIERYSLIVIINKNEYAIKLSKKKYGPLFRINNINYIKQLIIECHHQLQIKENSPKKLEELKLLKYLDQYFFLIIATKIYGKLFDEYISSLITQHIKFYNFDFKSFFIKNISHSWLYTTIKNQEKIFIKEKIRNIFFNEIEIQKIKLDTYIYKASDYTVQKNIWDIKYKGQLYTNILFNIPNDKVKNIIYNRNAFKQLISDIEIGLRQKNTLKNLLIEDYKNIAFILIVVVLFFKKDLEEALKNIIRELISTYQIIKITTIKEQLFGSYKIKTVNYIFSYHREGNITTNKQYSNELYKQFADIVINETNEGYEKQKSLIDLINKRQIDSNILQWKYFHIREGNIYVSNVDLTIYENYSILIELKEYINWLIISKKKISDKLLHFKQFFIDYFQIKYKYEDFSSFNIDNQIVRTFVLYLMSTQSISDKKNLSITSRKGIFTNIKGFFSFIIKHEISKKYGLQQLIINPFNDISFRQIDKHKKHYEALPEEVYCQILEHIDELDTNIKNAFLILSATGFRWSEIIGLEKDCLYIKNDQVYVKSIEHKNQISNIKKGKNLYRHIPLFDLNAIEAIKNQIQIYIQQDINSNFIFYKRTKNFYNSNYVLISNGFYNDSINKLIKQHNIQTEDGVTWHYSSHQMRARIATLMAENGFESEEIANFLNHVTTTTIDKAYAFVRKKRMSELNTKFFKDHFKSIIPKQYMNKLTKEEKEELYVHLSLDYRQMEYGKCIIPMSQGDCGKLQESSSCAACEYLITSKDYLPKWESFMKNQQKRIEELEKFYKKNKILSNEYHSYIEFQREIAYLDKYQDIVEKLRIY